MAREFARSERLGAQLQRSLSELLRFEIKDPRLRQVSLTDVDLSRDLSVARVYFSLLNPDDDPQPALDALQKASGFLRSRLGESLKTRHMPELRFLHDDSIAHGSAITKLIQDAIDQDPKDRG